MSDAYRCDRCNDLYGGEPRSTYIHDGGGLDYQAKPKKGDLCDDCSKDFKMFIVGRGISDE